LAGLGFDVNAPNEFGETALMDAAIIGNDQVAEVLLNFGADPNAKCAGRDTILHEAVQSGNARLVDLLLSAGAVCDYVTVARETVFDALPNDPGQRAAIANVLRRHGITEPDA
jgi:ankyrin repeat protein